MLKVLFPAVKGVCWVRKGHQNLQACSIAWIINTVFLTIVTLYSCSYCHSYIYYNFSVVAGINIRGWEMNQKELLEDSRSLEFRVQGQDKTALNSQGSDRTNL